MDVEHEFEALRRESSSWWYVARRKLLCEAVARAVSGRREARVLDLGCAAQPACADDPLFRVLNAHQSLPVLAARQLEGTRNLVCTSMEDLALTSNSFDAAIAGDVVQSASDDVVVLRELRRVLKDGGWLCLTVPAYPFLWGEEDEVRGHRRRYTASELRRKLNNSGFEISRISYFVACGFLPSVVQRISRNLFSKSIVRRTRTTPEWANRAMISALDAERQLIRFLNLPFGTRLICWARKPTLVAERVVVPAWERQWARGPLPQGMS